MAVRAPLVSVGGIPTALPAGDTLPAAALAAAVPASGGLLATSGTAGAAQAASAAQFLAALNALLASGIVPTAPTSGTPGLWLNGGYLYFS